MRSLSEQEKDARDLRILDLWGTGKNGGEIQVIMAGEGYHVTRSMIAGLLRRDRIEFPDQPLRRVAK